MAFSLNDSNKLRYKLSQKQAKSISRMYSDLAKEIDQKISSLNLDKVSGTMEMEYLRGLKNELAKELVNINQKLGTEIPKSMAKMCDSVVKENDSFFKSLGVDITEKMSHVSTDVVTNLMTGKVYKGDWSLSKSIWGDNKKQLSDINEIVAKGTALNKSAYEIAKDLESYVDPSAKKPWDWNKVYPGTKKKIDYNAQRLARTMVSHAYQQSLVATAKDNPFVKGIKWRSAHTERTCEICNSRDGVVYKPENLPLDHPNGLCTYIADVPSMDDVADRLADWVQGKEDPELDAWEQRLTGNSTKGDLVPTFNDTQNKWLGSMGYSPTSLPADFTEWSHKLSSSQKSELFSMLNLWGEAHPYQVMQVWYNNNLMQIQSIRTPPMIRKKYIKDAEKETQEILDKFSQARKDAALWAKTPEEADRLVRKKCGDIWRKARLYQKEGAYKYTAGSGHMNRPLRGGFLWDSENECGRSHIKGLTKLCEQSTYDFDMWLQRGVNSRGTSVFLGISESDLENPSKRDEIINKVVGSIRTDEAFISTATSKGKGLPGYIFNVYAPSGTKMFYAEPFSHYGGSSVMYNWDGESEQSFFGQEAEMIIQRGSSFRITKAEYNEKDKLGYFDMEVVAQDPLEEGKAHSGK